MLKRIAKVIVVSLVTGASLFVVATLLMDFINRDTDGPYHGLGNAGVATFIFGSLLVAGFIVINNRLKHISKRLDDFERSQAEKDES